MRLGLLSDVHANLAALQAVLRAFEGRGVEKLLVAGDLVGYGSQPNECVELLAEAGAVCVAGNHDLFVVDRLPPTRFPPLARRSAELTRRLLSNEARAYLEGLPLTTRLGSTYLAHGSPGNPEEYVVREARAFELLARLPDMAPGSDTLVLGHTHQQWCVVAGRGVVSARGHVDLPARPRLLNPGSVGQSRQRERRPRARCAVLDSGSARVEFLDVDYDVAASRRALHASGLSDRCLHAPPRLRDRALWKARSLGRAVLTGRAPRR